MCKKNLRKVMFPCSDEDWKEILIDDKASNAEKCSINAH